MTTAFGTRRVTGDTRIVSHGHLLWTWSRDSQKLRFSVRPAEHPASCRRSPSRFS